MGLLENAGASEILDEHLQVNRDKFSGKLLESLHRMKIASFI